MADGLIPPQPLSVQVLAEKSEAGRWFYNDLWWTPGDIRADGVIVGDRCFITAGVVWISTDKVAAAEAHRWRVNGIEAQNGELVQVMRYGPA